MRALCGLMLVLFICATLTGQAQKPAATFKAESHLVLVPVVVKTKAGNHLSGMTKEQFRLLQDGREQPIAVFEEVVPAKSPVVVASAQAAEFTNTVVEANKPRAMTVLALDLNNTPPLALTWVKQDLLNYIGNMAGQGEPTALVTLEPGRVRVVYDFTTDPKQLAEAVKRLKSRQIPGQNPTSVDNSRPYLMTEIPPARVFDGLSPDEAQRALDVLERQLQYWIQAKVGNDALARAQQRQVRRDTVESLRALAAALKPYPGRKTVIWISGGFQFAEDSMAVQAPQSAQQALERPKVMVAGPTAGSDTSSQSSGSNQPSIFDQQPSSSGSVGTTLSHGLPTTEALNDHTATWGFLNDADVAVYPIDARRLVNTNFDIINPEQKYSSLATDREMAVFKAQETTTTFENYAAATGGKPCYNRTDLSNCMQEAVDDGRSYYLLGYYVPAKTKAGWHKLQVKSNDKGSDLDIRARNGFLYSDQPADARPVVQQEMLAALASPINAIALPFRGTFGSVTEKNGKKAQQFILHLDWDALTMDKQNGNRISLEIVAVAFSADGKAAARFSQTIDNRLPEAAVAQLQQGGLGYKNVLELTPGAYNVRFVVRDNLTGRIGSVQVPLSVN